MFDVKIFDANKHPIDHVLQYDKDWTIMIKLVPIQKTLRITGDITVDFYNAKSTETILVASTVENNFVTVMIPNELLEEPYDIGGYLYQKTDNGSKTIAVFSINLIPRLKRGEEQP